MNGAKSMGPLVHGSISFSYRLRVPVSFAGVASREDLFWMKLDPDQSYAFSICADARRIYFACSLEATQKPSSYVDRSDTFYSACSRKNAELSGTVNRIFKRPSASIVVSVALRENCSKVWRSVDF